MVSGTETGDLNTYLQHRFFRDPVPVAVAETIAGTAPARPVVGVITTGDLDAFTSLVLDALGAKYRAGIRLDRALWTPEQREQADAEQSTASAAMWQGLSELYSKAAR